MEERIKQIMAKLHSKTALTVEELSSLQSHVDGLESRVGAAGPHHETHSTPGSHFTFHHAIAVDAAGILERTAHKEIGKQNGG